VPDGPSVTLLSDGFWRRAYGGDPAVIGSDILLSGQPYTVVGVMPASFLPPSFLGTDLWTPLQFDLSNGAGRGSAFLRSVGRLADGSSLELARSQATDLGNRLEQQFPEANTGVGYNVYPLRFDMVQQTSAALWMLLGAVGFVLLIACVNVANLLLARGASRRAELAIRVAIGAGRGRILSQLLTESLLMAVVGGAIGVGLAYVGTDILVGLAPTGTPRIDEVAVDGRILVFAAAVTALAGLIFGALPALHASRTEPATSLREGGRGASGVRAGRLRNTLVIGQVALALILLVGAGLLIRSFENLQNVELGFEPEGVLTLRTQMPGLRYPDAASRHDFMRPLEERLSAIPGVEAVGSVTNLPLAGSDGDVSFQVEGQPVPEPGQPQAVWLRRITPNYFDAMGLELVSGRPFNIADTDDQPQVVIINKTLEDDFFDGNALGKRLNVNDRDDPVWREIVGVAGDIKNFGIRAESRNAM
jgi:putative ABC transport system permease protein